MESFLSFVLLWLGIMALIGIALWLVPKISKNAKTKDNKEKIQDIADE